VVLEDGVQAEIAVFSNLRIPFTAVLLVDTSGSVSSRVLVVREGVVRFIEALDGADRLRIGSFGDEISLSPLLTGDKATLRRVAAEELWPGGGSPVWRALHEAGRSIAQEGGRKVVLVLTDGADTSQKAFGASSDGQANTRRFFHDGDVMLYAIGSDVNLPRSVTALVEESGGGHFRLQPDVDLADLFTGIAEELRHQYLIGFVPRSLDGREHRIEVRGPKGLSVRSRTSHVAAK
jgi:Ca-activated chloride channel family protein